MTTVVAEKAADTMPRAIVDRAALLEALRVLTPATSARNFKPVLACVRLEAADRQLLLRATNLSLSAEVRVGEVQVEGLGTAAVDCNALLRRVNAMTDDTVTIRPGSKPGYLALDGSDAHYDLPALPPDDFPPMPRAGEGDLLKKSKVSVPASELLSLIDRTAWATNRGSTIGWQNAVMLRVRGGHLSALGTDSHVCAFMEGPPSKEVVPAVLVPMEAVQFIHKAFDGEEGEVDIVVAENHVMVESVGVTVITTLFEEKAPAFDDYVPKGAASTAVADRDTMADAVERGSMASDEQLPHSTLEMSKAGMKVSARSPSGGESNVNYPCRYEGPNMRIVLNAGFLIGAIRNCPSDEVKVEFNGAASAMKVIGRDYLCLVSPFVTEG
jgi:DNA polymerase III subunit beta